MKLKNLIYIFIFALLGSCAGTSPIRNDPRFVSILDQPLMTKAPLRLYGIDYQKTGLKDLYDLTSTDSGEQNLIGFVPTGTRVNFTHALRLRGGGATSEYLVGAVKFENKSYAIGYNLGITHFPDGWRRFYDDFEVGGQ